MNGLWDLLLHGDRTRLRLDLDVGPLHLHTQGRAVFLLWVTVTILALCAGPR